MINVYGGGGGVDLICFELVDSLYSVSSARLGKLLSDSWSICLLKKLLSRSDETQLVTTLDANRDVEGLPVSTSSCWLPKMENLTSSLYHAPVLEG